MDAVAIVEGEVRELIRRRGVDPSRDVVDVRRLVEEAVADYDARSLSGGLPPLPDPGAAVKTVLDVVAGLGPLQPYLDDPRVEEIWVNEPGKVFVARDGVPELTTTILTADQVRDLVERMLKSSGRRVDLSSPFVDAMLADGSRLHVVIPDITRRHWAVNIRKFVVKADRLDDLVGLGTLTPPVRRVPRRRGRRRAERPRLGRDAGRQDHPAQLPGRRDPAARAGRHLRGGVRAQDPAARRRRRCSAASPTSRAPARSRCGGWSRRRCGCGPPGSSSARCGRRRASTCCIALNCGLPGMASIHANSAREAITKMCTLPLLAGENVGSRFVVPTVAACVDLVVHVALDADGVRRVREIVAVPAGSSRTWSRPPTSSPPAADAWCAPTASRRTPTGSRARASTSPRSCATRTLEPWALSSDSCSGQVSSWSGGPPGRRSRGRRGRPGHAPAGEHGSRTSCGRPT